MNALEDALEQELGSLRTQGLHRQLRRIDSAPTTTIELEGQQLLNFSSNDYLGLANEPALKEAAYRAIERYGTGSGASRLICGSLGIHHELDEALAALKGTEAALSFSTGYAAALGTICALLQKDDIIILDKLVHASIVDAARLSAAKLRVFPHNDLNRLEEILAWADKLAKVQAPQTAPQTTGSNLGSRMDARTRRILVVTESVFSMDGDHAPLREIVALKERYGSWLMVDEAHATGLYGTRRSGLIDALGIGRQVEIQMATLGKAIGASGGCICGSRKLVDFLTNRARSFVFSTAPVPAAAAAASAGVRFVQSELGAQRCQLLWERVEQVRAALGEESSNSRSAIVPVLIGKETAAVEASRSLREAGVFIPAIRYPTVARGEARLRLTVSAAHTNEQVAKLLRAFERLGLRGSGKNPLSG